MSTLQKGPKSRDLRDRTLRILAQEISFIHSRDFSRLTESQVEVERPEQVFESGAANDETSPSTDVMRSPLLTPSGEQYLFRKMNFFKYRANSLRSTLNPSRQARKKIEEIDRLLAEAEIARGTIIEANLRLVCSIAHKFANNPWEYDEFVSEGNLILLNAVDKFDYSRGFRFSTYATHSVQRHFFRLMQRRQRRRGRELSSPHDVLGDLAVAPEREQPLDYRIAEQLISHFDECLDDREKIIIQERFGLIDSQTAAETLKAVAEKVGLSKERVRQLQLRAIEKLQDLAARLNLRLEPTL